jgi:hypothetical protein
MSLADHIIEAITVAPGDPADLRGRDPAWTGGDALADLATAEPRALARDRLAAIDEARAALLAEA